MSFSFTFEKYMEDVKSQLYCNAPDEYKENNVTFMYDEKCINENIDYFKKTYNKQMSAYMALNFLYYEK